jgi:hypothetical protein
MLDAFVAALDEHGFGSASSRRYPAVNHYITVARNFREARPDVGDGNVECAFDVSCVPFRITAHVENNWRCIAREPLSKVAGQNGFDIGSGGGSA